MLSQLALWGAPTWDNKIAAASEEAYPARPVPIAQGYGLGCRSLMAALYSSGKH